MTERLAFRRILLKKIVGDRLWSKAYRLRICPSPATMRLQTSYSGRPRGRALERRLLDLTDIVILLFLFLPFGICFGNSGILTILLLLQYAYQVSRNALEASISGGLTMSLSDSTQWISSRQVKPIPRCCRTLIASTTGFYEPIRKQLNRFSGYKSSDQVAWTSVAAGAGSGIIGGTFSCHPGV